MESRMVKIFSQQNKALFLRVYEGHFVTPHSHITHYFDFTTMKYRLSEAQQAAATLSQKYETSTIVDTIVCMDGTEVIGAFLAESLTNAGIMSMNLHQTIYVMAPEFNPSGQLIFRDNVRMMIENKNVVILMASATTGKTLQSCIESVLYYGGTVRGVSALFSAIDKIENVEVNAIFREYDVPHYKSFRPSECPYCKEGRKIDALVNSYGYSKL